MENNEQFNYDGSTITHYDRCCSPRDKYRKSTGRFFKKPSQLVPDQTYTIKQLFERSVVGSMPDGLVRPFYAEDTNDIDKLFQRSGIDLTTLDLTELDDYKERLNERIEDMKRRLTAK